MKLQMIEQSIKLNGLDENPVGSGVLNIMYAGEDDLVEVNETTGNIEIKADGEDEVKIYSLKEDGSAQPKVEEPAQEEADTKEDAVK